MSEVVPFTVRKDGTIIRHLPLRPTAAERRFIDKHLASYRRRVAHLDQPVREADDE